MKRKIINSIYGVAVAAVAVLSGIVIFGRNIGVDYETETMLNYSLGDRAFFLLMAAAIPLLFFGMAVCRVNDIRNSKHPKLYSALIYLPAVVCMGCIVFTVGTVVIGMVATFIRQYREFSQLMQ